MCNSRRILIILYKGLLQIEENVLQDLLNILT